MQGLGLGFRVKGLTTPLGHCVDDQLWRHIMAVTLPIPCNTTRNQEVGEVQDPSCLFKVYNKNRDSNWLLRLPYGAW